MLETIDQAWKQHMLNLDHLKEGIHLRGYSQSNPLIEYKREAFALFEEMVQEMRRAIVHHIFHVNTQHFNAQELERKRERELANMNFSSAESQAPGAVKQEVRREEKVGRNDQCPCGSGKKYKKCHGE